MSKSNLTKRQIQDVLWEKGILRWKCHPVQEEMYDIFYNSRRRSTLVWLCSRQLGKSFTLTLLAYEQALRKPFSIIKLLTDTKLHVESIFVPLFNELGEDCPQHLRPEYLPSKYKFVFPNGSEVQIAGSDNGHYERLRGQKSDLVLVDEAGFCTNLKYIIRSVLFSTTTHTGGKIVLASTAPVDPQHEFIDFIDRAKQLGHLTEKTIYDNPLLTQEDIDIAIEELGGVDSPDFQRECMCKIIRDESLNVFPEFDEHLQEEIIREWERPSHYDTYVAMDLGYKDYTAVLFMYYDYRNDKIIVEDEIVLEGAKMKLPDLAKDILKKEEELWTSPLTHEKREPLKRISDINHIVTQEMGRATDYRLTFLPPDKFTTDNEAMINNLRVLLSQGKIIIHPRCKYLISHLDGCKWKKSSTGKREFARTEAHKHFDTVDALKYGVKAINFNRNPYPPGYDLNLRENVAYHIQNPSAFNGGSSTVEVYNQIFGKKKF